MNTWALVGLGFIAPRHIKSIKAVGDRLLLTCDSDPAKCADFTDWQEMIKDPRWQEVTHVSICTPNYLHYDMIQGMKDKVVLCEKPITLTSWQVERLPQNVYTVLQLRHHPTIQNLKATLKGRHTASLIVKVKRDWSYWEGWKGKEEKSGGILFNLGIHYFDILLYLFGHDYQVRRSAYAPHLAQGEIDFNGTKVSYHMEIMQNEEGQDRSLEIDGQVVSLSKQGNLSIEDLHLNVYQDLQQGKGVKPSEAYKSIRLVEQLKHGL